MCYKPLHVLFLQVCHLLPEHIYVCVHLHVHIAHAYSKHSSSLLLLPVIGAF